MGTTPTRTPALAPWPAAFAYGPLASEKTRQSTTKSQLPMDSTLQLPRCPSRSAHRPGESSRTRPLLPVRVAGGVAAGFVAFRAAPRRLRFLDGRGCSGWWTLPFFELSAHRMRAEEVHGFSPSLLPIHVALGVTTGALAIRARPRRWRLLFLLQWWRHGLRGRIEVHDVIDAASAVAAHATFGPWW